jgi:4'-phosphopantetheinyl transferase
MGRGVDVKQVYWLEQTEAGVPAENDWLSASESVCLNGMRFAKRRADGRLGRWTAKCAVACFWNLPASPQALAEIEIRPAPSGAPEVLLAKAPAQVAISLSHRAGRAMCAVARSGVQLGCDLEIIEPRTEAFVADYFTPEERAWIACAPEAERFRLLALLWSGKESSLKALRTGLRLDTRSVVVTPLEGSLEMNGWRPLQVRCSDGHVLQGWWQCAHKVVRTLVADPPPMPPILLSVSSYFAESSSHYASSTGD